MFAYSFIHWTNNTAAYVTHMYIVGIFMLVHSRYFTLSK